MERAVGARDAGSDTLRGCRQLGRITPRAGGRLRFSFSLRPPARADGRSPKKEAALP
jgi:hypothetical protein